MYCSVWPAYKQQVAAILDIFPLDDEFIEVGDFFFSEGTGSMMKKMFANFGEDWDKEGPPTGEWPPL